MTWGNVIGAGVALYGAKKASSNTSKANKNADAANKTAIETQQKADAFQQEVYNDWKDTFGDLQTNLGEYYKNLSPDFATAQGLQAFEKEKERALVGMRENFEQRGIGTSGLAARAESDVGMLSAVERAKIRANAPREVAAEKLGFLNAGLASSPVAGIFNANNLAANRITAANNLSSSNAADAEASKWDAYGEAGKAVVGAIEGIGAARKAKEPTDAV
jgi:hypothetical protein